MDKQLNIDKIRRTDVLSNSSTMHSMAVHQCAVEFTEIYLRVANKWRQ